MNRNPSTTIKPAHAVGPLPPSNAARKEAFAAMWAAAKAAFPADVDGFVSIDANRAFFQKTGDRTPYSIAITADESRTLGFIAPDARIASA